MDDGWARDIENQNTQSPVEDPLLRRSNLAVRTGGAIAADNKL